MDMGVSERHGNCQSDSSSCLKQPADKLGDNSINGTKSSEPAQQECNTAPELEIGPSKAMDFISASDVSGEVNISSLIPDSLLNTIGVSDRGESNNKQITDAESTHSELHKHAVGFDAQCELEEYVVSADKLASFSGDASRNFTESMLSEGHRCEVSIYAQTRLEESTTKGSVILSDKLTTYSEEVSRNFTESMHSEENQRELEISHSMLEATGNKLSPILAAKPSNVFEDKARNSTTEHFGPLDDSRVPSTAENMGLHHERTVYSKSEILNPNIRDARENVSRAGVGDKISLPLVDCDALDLPPKTNSLDANLVQRLQHCDGKNANLPSPPEKEAIESSGLPVTGKEGTPKESRKKIKSTTESPAVSTRLLRSRSKDKPETPLPSNVAVKVIDAVEKKRNRKKKQMKKHPISEFSRMRKHLRYLLHRIKFEQNFIDAYSSEGWRNQSLEKIKPEKELERAKTHILHYKVKIRDLFQRLDLSLTEGQIPESLFDSEGEIESEDIFCAKCGSKDVSLENDIILCDGACERGFHQFCLDPPLRKEDIPQGDEGWLCPGCDCKVDCLDLLNDMNVVKLSVLDSWEKVFPEADAAASGKTLDDGFGLPSDDSEDDDYDPDKIEVDEKELPDQETSSDESNYLSTSDGSSGSPTKPASPTKEDYMGLPSDDSEDDDFDPVAPNEDDQVKEEFSSDFTSDSEDLGAVLQDYSSTGDDQGQSNHNGEELEVGVRVKRRSLKDEISFLLNSNESPLSAKRHVERLDYKRLHDETYGNESSDSSDEDFEEKAGQKRRKGVSGRISSKGSASAGNESDIMREDGDQEEGRSAKQADKQLDSQYRNKLSVSHASSSETGSVKRNNSKKLGEAVTQRLLESFKQNQYLKRPDKENLARDLGLTVQQVSKWFENARRSSRHLATMEINGTSGSSGGQTSSQRGKDKSKDERQMDDRKVALSDANNITTSPETDLGAKLTQIVDVVVEPLIAESPSEQKSGTPRTRKRINEKDEQPPSSGEKKLKEISQADSPEPKQVRRSSRLQSTSNTET